MAAAVTRLTPGPCPVWITGTTEVQIVGESFHLAGIVAAEIAKYRRSASCATL